METLTLLLVGLSAFVGCILYFIHQHLTYWSRRGIPSEKPHLLMGNIRGAMIDRPLVELTVEFYRKYRDCLPFMGYYWFAKPAVFVTDPLLIKHIMIKDFSKFTDRGMFHNEKDDPLTGILFNLDGMKWRNMRNKLTPTFTAGKMKQMLPLVSAAGEELLRVFRDTIKSDQVVEVRDLMARFTSDVIGSCAFGIETSSLKDPLSEFRKKTLKAFREFRLGTIGFGFRMNFPQLAQMLRMKETLPDIEEYFMGLTKTAIDFRLQNNVRRNDFLDTMIDMMNNKMLKSETGDELTALTFGEVAAQSFMILLAGFETSSTTLSFALYELARNPLVQQKAREEVAVVLERHDQEFSYECVKDLVYLEQIMDETLRLYTVVPVLNRIALEDYVVPDHPKYVIEKGTTIVIPISAIHRDERYYPNPNEFNPDNFTPEAIKARDAILHIPFGDGPRICIGKRFGVMTVKVGLAKLLQNFKFSVCEKTPIPMEYDKVSFTVAAGKGIYLKVEKL